MTVRAIALVFVTMLAFNSSCSDFRPVRKIEKYAPPLKSRTIGVMSFIKNNNTYYFNSSISAIMADELKGKGYNTISYSEPYGHKYTDKWIQNFFDQNKNIFLQIANEQRYDCIYVGVDASFKHENKPATYNIFIRIYDAMSGVKLVADGVEEWRKAEKKTNPGSTLVSGKDLTTEQIEYTETLTETGSRARQKLINRF